MASLSVTLADVQARMGTQAYLKAFAQNGQASVDTTWLQTHLDDAIDEVESRLRKHFGDDFPSSLVTNRMLIRAVVSFTIAFATENHPGNGAGANGQQQGPYQAHRTRAEAILKQVCADLIRPSTSDERPNPRARVELDVDSEGTPTNPFSRIVDLRDKSMY